MIKVVGPKKLKQNYGVSSAKKGFGFQIDFTRVIFDTENRIHVRREVFQNMVCSIVWKLQLLFEATFGL